MNLSIIAKDLFNKIRGQFPSVQLGDSQGTITKKPEEARFFDFDFNHGGNTLGKVSISISEDEGLVVLHNKDFTEGTDEAVKNAWYGFLKEMGQFAKARVLGFDTRDITKSNLENDLEQNQDYVLRFLPLKKKLPSTCTGGAKRPL